MLLENCNLYDLLVSELRVVRCRFVIILVINKSDPPPPTPHGHDYSLMIL